VLTESRAALRVEEVGTTAELEALRPEWSALWESSDSATPFQSPEWLIPWWRHFGWEGLRVLTLRRAEGGRLVGLAPLYIYTHPDTGTRQVTLIGNGISDHLDVLVDPEIRTDAGVAFLTYLAKHGASWDTCDLRDLAAGSQLLTAPLPDGVAEEVVEEEPSPFIVLPCSVESLGDAVPQKFLHKLRYYRRRAEQLGEVCFEAAHDCKNDVADEEKVQETFGKLLELHRARWATRGEPGVLDDPAVEAFHRDAIPGFLARGWLRLYTLRIGARIGAVYYGFLAKGRAYAYLGGFDPVFLPAAPGKLIVLHAMTEAVREGAREFDFLRGREPYKHAWGAEDRPQYRRRLRHAAD